MSAVEVHAVVDGPADAPVVLLAGSLGSTLQMWDPQVPALAERFRVVYHERTVGKILRQLGFSHISARPHHPAQDGQTVAAFKKTSRLR